MPVAITRAHANQREPGAQHRQKLAIERHGTAMVPHLQDVDRFEVALSLDFVEHALLGVPGEQHAFCPVTHDKHNARLVRAGIGDRLVWSENVEFERTLTKHVAAGDLPSRGISESALQPAENRRVLGESPARNE
jgi:hypothetical protein